MKTGGHSLSSQIIDAMNNLGFKTRIVSVDRIQDLKREIRHAHSRGMFDERFYRERLLKYHFEVSETLPGVRSIIIVTVFQPILKVVFTRYGQAVEVIIPPTYRTDTDQQVFDQIVRILHPKGYRLMKAVLPEKLLLVRSGLAKYGKNNITYVDGMGSFHRPVAFVADAPLEADEWIQPQTLSECTRCKACLKKCPTGAISDDRFLLYAERCLTFYNERDAQFPSWMNPSWHHCLIGCMECQMICPVNKPYIECIEKATDFTEEETNLFLMNVPREKLDEETIQKLRMIGMLDDYHLISRNLGVLLNPDSV
ncbi:MAG: 4Fe-4S double cluster binding domain-containing protein [bacterium]